MAQTRVQQTRKYKTGERPASGIVGELFVNTADLQIGIVDDYADVVDLLGVRNYSDRCVYHVDEFVIYNGFMYKCLQQTVAGNFNPSYWAKFEAKKGDTGAQGPKGDKGDSIVGPMGPHGLKGDQGPPGEIGKPVGDFRYRTPAELPPTGLIPKDWDGPNRPVAAFQMQRGQGLIDYHNGHIWVFTAVAGIASGGGIAPQLGPQGWLDAGRIQGPPGPQGDVGPQGPQGVQGLKGDQGPAGRIARPTGDFSRAPADLPWDGLMPANWDSPGKPAADVQFAIGDALEHLPTNEWWLFVTDVESPAGWVNIGKIRGEQGIQGIQGPMGPMGPAGKDGRDGVDGVDGVGSVGPAGPPGAASTVPGPQGPPGASITGPQGPQGASFAQTVIVSGAGPDNAQGAENWFWVQIV